MKKAMKGMGSPLNETASFLQHVLPGLDDGTYRMTVSQNVNDSAGNPISDDSLTRSYKFAVLGDQFALQRPSDVVFALFPADQASGEFTTVLPHVVFRKPSFPWARYPTNDPPAAPPPGGDTDADVPTWLAVLLLDEDDLAAFPQLKLDPATRTLGDLIATSINSSSSLGNNYSYFFKATSMPALEIGETLGTSVRTVDVPLPLFWETAPSLSDLALLAHVREVSLINKPTNSGAADPGEPTGRFSIVFGNRLPQTGRKSYAYLVSLEELQDLLPNSDGTPPSGNFDRTRFIRLAVLQSWTFFSTGESATFIHQLLALNGRGTGDAADTTLTIPYSGPNPVVQDALSMSYVPLNHQLRTPARLAQQTVSWVRGPLVPYDTGLPKVELPIASPDQVTIFDPTTGMLDVSYAAAWLLGRQLALQNSAFATALYDWKKGLTQAVVDAIELEILSEALHPLLGSDADSSLFRQMVVSLAANKRT